MCWINGSDRARLTNKRNSQCWEMDLVPVAKLSHKEWRKQAKKERRRRLRTREARARDCDAERLAAALEKTAEYLNWVETQRANEELKEIQEAKEHEIRERQWLEEEVRAQKEWRIQQDRKAKARQEQLEQETRIRKEFEAKQEVLRLKKEEVRRREEEESNRLAEVQREIDAYIDEGARTPEVLRTVKSTQPGKEPCPFFSKTGACRYGDTCSRNHQRLALSRVLLIPGFYSHFSLEKNSAEYDTDVALEFDGPEMRQHFREFYNDVVPELENFGRIKTLRFCRNTEIHLRGNMYVEYYSEREAARALRSLKGRWYAGRQLNCEFTNLKSWRNAVCGMPKCPKGRACNFLHTLRNPRDEYDIKSPPRSSRLRPGTGQDDRRFSGGPTTSSRSSRIDQESSRSGSRQHQQSREDSARNWRWSDSPDSGPESPSRSARSEDRRGGRDEQRSSRRPRKRHRDSRRSRNRRSGDEGSEDEIEVDAGREKRAENSSSSSRSKSKTKKKRKKRSRDEEAEDQDEETKIRGGTSHRNGKSRSSAESSKDRSRKRNPSKKSSEKIERTKWDDPNGTTDSESDSNLGSSKRRRRTSRRSPSPSWSDVEASEALTTSVPETEGRKIRPPHR